MSYTLKFEHPHFDPDAEFAIANFGVVKNGGSLELDEEAERVFVMERGLSVEDAFKGDTTMQLSGSSSLSPDELKSLLPPPEEEETPVLTTATTTTANVAQQPELPPSQDEGGENLDA